MHRCRLLRIFCVHISEGEHVVKAIFAPIVVAATPAEGGGILESAEKHVPDREIGEIIRVMPDLMMHPM